MQNPFSNLLTALDLKPLKDDSFEGTNLYIPTNNTYGGLFLAQSIIAAAKTTSEFRFPNSLHAIFVRPGNISFPTIYKVQRLRDGAKYSHRRVDAFQNDELLFSAFVMFHEGENTGANFQTKTFPPKSIIKSPQKFVSVEKKYSKYAKKSVWFDYFVNKMAFENRDCNSSLFLGKDKLSESGDTVINASWNRIREKDAEEFKKKIEKMSEFEKGVLNCALLAFLSDQFGFMPAIRQGGLSWTIEGVSFASLDHTMHFYKHDFDLTEWFLVAGESPYASDGRGIGFSDIFSESEEMIASFSQEGLLRTP